MDNEYISIFSFNHIFNTINIQKLFAEIVKPDMEYFLNNLDYRSFNDIQNKEDFNKIKVIHCINFLIDNRTNINHVIDYDKLRSKKIKIRDILHTENYTKWFNVYQAVSILLKKKDAIGF